MVTAKKPSPGPETKRIEAMKDTPITPRRLMVIGTYMAALMTAGGWVVSEWVTPKVLAKAGEQLDEVREQMDGELAATVQKVFDRVDEKIELHRQSGSHPETAEAMERVERQLQTLATKEGQQQIRGDVQRLDTRVRVVEQKVGGQ